MGTVIKFPTKTKEGRAPLNPDLSDRIARIRASLDRINQLMGELKKLNEGDNKDVDSTKR